MIKFYCKPHSLYFVRLDGFVPIAMPSYSSPQPRFAATHVAHRIYRCWRTCRLDHAHHTHMRVCGCCRHTDYTTITRFCYTALLYPQWIGSSLRGLFPHLTGTGGLTVVILVLTR